ncbi:MULTISPECIES: hypothetical protein [Lactobacillus]|jgi:conserved domain protein|uniref:Uncharacterized protein n=2 Tax=Lactobacillus gasseri TaxID=1596 RepID=D1YIY4_LACGS|nr:MULTISPECIES: hypothetical protein [Lactobacillus]EFB62505.1 hypothetical protein HMPREF9209_0065 [Lactobacillus gasseri 224-1]KFL96375.1 hypothetical protein HMPREF5175_01888 [Lactobacillus gasseri SV-16A-US]MCZ3850720.1 hypothetical protein [Lactobacillus gasseri]MCZ3852568.1 hypothetical protein [Lactobacillus gasseri]MCZ3861187.1 hypothetical protein [Lactobacillus gasseri]
MKKDRLIQSLKNKLKNSGNVPNQVFKMYLSQYESVDQLTPLLLKFESKKRNIDLIQKIYWWILTTLTVGIIASGIISLRTLGSQYNDTFSNIIGTWIAFIISYLGLMITIEIVIQSKKNSIYNNLKLIQKHIESLKKNNENMVRK